MWVQGGLTPMLEQHSHGDLPGRRNVLRWVATFAAACSTSMRLPMLAQAFSGHSSPVAEPKFDVISIRLSKPGGGQSMSFGYGPDGYRARNQSMWATIMVAYYPLSNQYWRGDRLIGGPKWLEENYDIEAKVSSEDVTAWQHQGPENKMLKPMLQAALRERCRLAVHPATVEGSIFQLVVAKRGLPTLVLN